MELTPELIDDLRKVIQYNWEAEQADYDREGPDENHIFESLRRLSESVRVTAE